VIAACAPIAVPAGAGALSYAVRVESAGATCAEARAELRRYVSTGTSSPQWTCFRGHGGDSWAAACARGQAIVRAYGPKQVTDAWVAGAAHLSMPVLRPPTPAGLRLISVKPQKLKSCGATREQITAVYRGGGRELYAIEGKPRVCGDVGEVKPVGKPSVRGHGGALFRLGPGEYLLIWSERGIQVGFQTSGFTTAQLVGFALASKVVLR
jgi:hypothetical protein